MRKFELVLITVVSVAACTPAKAQNGQPSCIVLRDDPQVVTRQLTVASGEREWQGGLSVDDYRPDGNIMQFSDFATGERLELKVDGTFRISVVRQVEQSNPTAQMMQPEIVSHDEGEATVTIPLNELRAKDGVLFGRYDEGCASEIGGGGTLGLGAELQFGVPAFEADNITVDDTGEALQATGRLIRYEKLFPSGGGNPLDSLGVNKGG